MVAAEEAREAIEWKQAPFELTAERFQSVPRRLKRALARLVGAPEDQIVLGNSTSYGLHLLANGIPWRSGDEIIVVAGDFPANILPWLGLERRGVTVKSIRPRAPLPDPMELDAAISPNTRLFCTTWVDSFSGYRADIEALGAVCRQHNVKFVVNASQALGALPLNVSEIPMDALVCAGFKWLCGPYGTGFSWINPTLLESLEYNQNHWLAAMTEEDLGKQKSEWYAVKRRCDAKNFDLFGTANFFNFKPWAASIEYLLDQRIDRIARYDQSLVEGFIDGLDLRKYELRSPRRRDARSNLIFISHRDPKVNAHVRISLALAAIDIAYRAESIRISPHLYNTEQDITKALTVLNKI